MSFYFGEIRPFTGPLPGGWAPCDGRALAVDLYPALHSLLGERFGDDRGDGGDGGESFNLPDLRGPATAGDVVNWGIALRGTLPAPE